MKNKTITAILLPFLAFSLDAFSNSSYNGDSSSSNYVFSTPGMDLLNDAMNIKYSSRKDNNPHYRYSNSIKSSIERDLLNSARMIVRQHLDEQKKLAANRKKAFAREHMLATAWTYSRTGTASGMTWYDLSPQEKNMFRERYIDRFQPKNNSSSQYAQSKHKPFLKTKSSATEDQIKLTWRRSEVGRKDGRPWSILAESEKQYYRNIFLGQKPNSLLPNDPTKITQSEYQKAWLVLREVDKDWDELCAYEKSSFRREFSIKVRYEPDTLIAMPDTLVALK